MSFRCPACDADLIIPHPQAGKVTAEQRMYLWLLDLLMDSSATRADKARARRIMVDLGVAPPAKPRAATRGGGLFGDLIRETLSERIDG